MVYSSKVDSVRRGKIPPSTTVFYFARNLSCRTRKSVIREAKYRMVKTLLLQLDLQYFATDGDGAAEGGNGGDSWLDTYYPNDTGEKGSAADKQADNMIPKARFDKVNAKYKELTELNATKQAEYDELVKKLDEGTESYKKLEESFTASNERIEALEGLLKSMLDAELELIDEEYHELVPKDKPIEQQLEWLTKAKQKGLFVKTSFEFEIGQPSNPRQNGKGHKVYEGMNPIQLLKMGYGN